MFTRPIGKIVIPFVAVALTLGAASCSNDAKDGEKTPTTSKTAVKASGPTTKAVTLKDPTEAAFTVKVPKGWDNQAYSTGEFDVHREVVISESPDGGTVLFMGDPKIPNYWNPATANEITRTFADKLDYMELKSYVPAEQYFRTWAKDKFGKLDNFKIESVKPNDKIVNSYHKAASDAGLPNAPAHGANVNISYTEGKEKFNALVVGLTVDAGDFWIADVNGLSTNGDVDDYLPMLEAMSKSKKTNPEWTQRSAERHAATMADIQAHTEKLQALHTENMAWIQASAERHQAKMQALWASNDASIQSFNERMASGDNTQRRFLNYINEEETVTNSSGQNFQVATGYQNYYMNKDGKTYVGGDINFDDSSIRRLGLNPDDYEPVKIKG